VKPDVVFLWQIPVMYDVMAPLMMMVMMYRTAAAAARHAAPSPAVDWTHLLTAAVPVTAVGRTTALVPPVYFPTIQRPTLRRGQKPTP